ncbi:MAG TPA: hypothetical protein VGX45_10480 [Solirubrobacteraceae bacterium]|nr:hypothetical protein [Solirubrobacteraceae bacterium]
MRDIRVALPDPIMQADVCCTLCTQEGFAARLASTPGDKVMTAFCGAPAELSKVIDVV